MIRFDTDASFSVDVDKSASERISETKIVNVGRDYRVSVTGNSKEVVGKRKVIDAHEEIMIRCGNASLLLRADGSIEMNGRRLDIEQSEAIVAKAGKIDLN
ncbi:hypothetical protein ACG74X_20460 [Marivita sp. S0852]|uniref:hypothetical protein n=1 Tax=Marivita sp. S0852 TaxID=3373893 RepID=UPI0039824D5A